MTRGKKNRTSAVHVAASGGEEGEGEGSEGSLWGVTCLWEGRRGSKEALWGVRVGDDSVIGVRGQTLGEEKRESGGGGREDVMVRKEGKVREREKK